MLVQQQEVLYLNFINSIKSDVTKAIYEYNLRLFMEFCQSADFDDLIGQQDKIIPYYDASSYVMEQSIKDDRLAVQSANLISTNQKERANNIHGEHKEGHTLSSQF